MKNKIKDFLCHFDNLYILLLFFILSLTFSISVQINNFPNSDTYFLAETGRYIVENKVVPTINPFVIHDGLGIIVQQWLFDILIYFVYKAFGMTGFFIYSAIISFVSIFIMYNFFGLYTKNVKVQLFLTSIFLWFMNAFFCTRPTSITLFLFVATMTVLEKYRQTHKTKILLFLPLISLLLINLHASFWPIIFVFIVPFVFFDKIPPIFNKPEMIKYIKDWFNKNKYIFISTISMFLVGFINPNGIKGMLYLFLSYSSATQNDTILELKNPIIYSESGVYFLIAVAAIYFYVQKHKDNLNFPLLYTALGTTFLAIMHHRNFWFYTLGVLPMLGILFNETKILGNKSSLPTPTKKQWRAIFLNIFVGIIAFVSITSFAVYKLQSMPIDCFSRPTKAIEYLEDKNKEDVILYAEFNGQFFQFHGYKTFMDARPEIYQEKINGKYNYYDEYIDVLNGDANYKEFVDKYKFTHIISPKSRPFTVYLDYSDEYKKVVTGENYYLYERIVE